MKDQEFEVIDELYFLSSFQHLHSKFDLPEAALQQQLKSLIEKGWIKCLDIETENELEDFSKFDLNYKKYNYLVSKAGLIAHNSR